MNMKSGPTEEFENKFKDILFEFSNDLSFERTDANFDSIMRTNIKDLGINSIQFIKLIVALESAFDIEFESLDLDIDNFLTLENLKEHTLRILNNPDSFIEGIEIPPIIR